MKAIVLLSVSLSYPTAMEPLVNIYSVTQFGAIANDQKDDSDAFQDALSTLQDGDTLIVPDGHYLLCNTISLLNKKEVSIIGIGKPELSKCAPFSGEYLFYVKYTDGLWVNNLTFNGLNNGDIEPVWGEQGLYLASTANSYIVNSHFRYFGDAALRLTTSADEEMYAVTSNNITVMQNTFENCGQVTTTQATAGTQLGGSKNILFKGNNFNGCTLKLSSRTEVSNAKILNNTFQNINGTAVELSYYSDVLFEKNKVKNINGFLINVYPNTRAEKNVKWGDIRINDNVFDGSEQGIRLQSFVNTENSVDPIRNISITNNMFQNIKFDNVNESKYRSIIRTLTQNNELSFSNVTIKNNQYRLEDRTTFISIDPKTKKIDIEENHPL